MWGDIAISFLLAFFASFVTVPYTIRLAKRAGAIDEPNNRKVNKKPIPRIGGIAILVGFIVSAIYLIVALTIEKKIDLNDIDNYKIKLIGFFIGIVIIELFALLDDIKNLPPLVKLLAQVIAACVVYYFGIRIDIINGTEIQPFFSFILTIGWIIGITNAINLIDGLDGLSSGIGLISCFSLLIIFATNYSPLVSIILITALAGAILGFLPFNIYPAKTFMGDVGAQFIGFSLSVIGILGVAKTVTLFVFIAPVLVLGLPIFDTLFAIIRRLIKGKSFKAVFEADKGHLHHRLMKLGFTQKQSVAILYVFSATLGMLAIIMIEDGLWKTASFVLLLMVLVAIGYKEIKKFEEELIAENKELGLVENSDEKKE